ncbi:ATP-binding protein [Jatrophihabitans sp. YIM 134969]
MTARAPQTFVGRQAELEALGAALEQAALGRPRIVVVEGDAGIGKTALLRRFVASLDPDRVIWASGEESERGLEFGVCAQLAAALPGVRVREGDGFPAVGTALLAGLGARQDNGPVAVVVDDLHWADHSSTQALLFCLRRLHRDAVVAAVTVRTGQVDALGPGWAHLFADGGRVERLRLSGLHLAEVGELAAASGLTSTPGATQHLHEHTAGNPLYIRALLSEVAPEALAERLGVLPAPRAFAATVHARMARIGAPAREFVSALSVLGRRAPLSAVCAVVGDSAATAADGAAAADAAAADAALRAGLIEVVVEGPDPTLGFTHPLVQAAVYTDLSLARRRRLHASAGEVLPPPTSLRHRVAATGPDGDAELAQDLRDAAEQARRGGRTLTAADLLNDAAAVEPDVERRDCSLYAGLELRLFGGDLAGLVRDVATVEARPDTPDRRYTQAIFDLVDGRLESVVARLRALVAESPPPDHADLWARAGGVLALVEIMCGRPADAVRCAHAALRLSAPDSHAEAMATQALGLGHAHLLDFESSAGALATASRHRRTPSASEAELLAARGLTLVWQGRDDEAIADLSVVTGWIQDGVATSHTTHVYAALAEAEFRCGDWRSAVQHVGSALSLAEHLAHPWHVPYAHGVATQLYSTQGDLVAAREHARAATAAVASAGTVEAQGYATSAAVHIAWAEQRWADLLHLGDDDAGRRHPNLTLTRLRAAEAAIMLGRTDLGMRLLESTPPHGGVTAAGVLRVRSLAQRRTGDSEKAQVALAEWWQRSGDRASRFDEALLAVEYGAVSIATGASTQAVAPLLRARKIFDGLAVLPVLAPVSECDRLLRVVDSVPPPPRPPSLEGLTDKEQVVARMVATGMTNREVAAELYVSDKAVEYHLHNIFTKLGLRSRRELRTRVPGHDAGQIGAGQLGAGLGSDGGGRGRLDDVPRW